MLTVLIRVPVLADTKKKKEEKKRQRGSPTLDCPPPTPTPPASLCCSSPGESQARVFRFLRRFSPWLFLHGGVIDADTPAVSLFLFGFSVRWSSAVFVIHIVCSVEEVDAGQKSKGRGHFLLYMNFIKSVLGASLQL
jgi:hypothetical protein